MNKAVEFSSVLDVVPLALLPEPHLMTSAEFEAVAVAVPLVNHGRQWEVFVNDKSLGFSDGASIKDAVIDVHKREVNNALYWNSIEPDAMPEWIKEKAAMPPDHVLAEYPDLQEKFADVIRDVAAKEAAAGELTPVYLPAAEYEKQYLPNPRFNEPTPVVSAGMYVGKIMAIDGNLVGQKAGRDPNVLIWHDRTNLQGGADLKIHDVVDINYKDGVGVVGGLGVEGKDRGR